MKYLHHTCQFAMLACLLLGCGKNNSTPQDDPVAGGSNSFRCKKNGADWIPTPSGGYTGTNSTSGGFAAYNTDSIPNVIIQAFRTGETVELFLNNVHHTGTYTLGAFAGLALHAYSAKNYGAVIVKTNGVEKLYHTDESHCGYITISYIGYDKKIVAGEFEFDAVHAATGEVIHVSSGEFDYTTHL